MYATPVLCGPLSALVVVSPSETKYDLGELLSQREESCLHSHSPT